MKPGVLGALDHHRHMLWLRFKDSFEYSRWWLFIERHVYAKHNVEVIADFEHRMSVVLCECTRGMSKPYYTADAMCAEIQLFLSDRYDEGYEDAKKDFGLDDEV